MAKGKGFKVDKQGFETAAKAILSESASYHKEYNKMKAGVETLTSSSWSGPDADAFKKAFNEFAETFDDVKTFLDATSEFIQASGAAYEDTSSQLSTAFNKR